MTDPITPPHNLEAEEAVLGAVFIDPDTLAECNLHVDEFYLVKHKWVWQAFSTLTAAGREIDLLTVQEELARLNQLSDIGGPAYLTRLVTRTPTAYNAPSYAALVKEAATRRRLLATASELAKAALDKAANVSEIGPAFAATLDGMTPAQGVNTDAFDASAIWYSRLEDRLTGPNKLRGMTTGYGKLDDRTDGIKRGELTILAALPSMGKSSLAFQMAYRQARNGLRVGIFSCEMVLEDVINRMALAALGINERKLKPHDLPALEQQRNVIAQLPIVINSESGLIVAEIAKHAREMSRTMHGLDVVYVDHLGYINHTGEKYDNLPTRIGMSTKGLARLSKQLSIGVVCLCQLNRDKTRGKDTPPTLTDLRDSGHIEADARMVLAIHRPQYFADADSVDINAQQDAWIVVAKNHNGPRNVTAQLKFVEATAQFLE